MAKNKTLTELKKENFALKMQFRVAVFFIFLLMIPFAINSYYSNHNFEGIYNPLTGSITIFKNSNTLEDRDYLYLHERCHAFYYEFLREEQRQQYNEIYKNSTEFPTYYSKTNVREDFADSCKLFIMGSLLDKPRLEFFKGKKYSLATLKTKI